MELVVSLASVALVGLLGFTRLGASFRDAIENGSDAGHARAPSASVGAQAASASAFEHLAALADKIGGGGLRHGASTFEDGARVVERVESASVKGNAARLKGADYLTHVHPETGLRIHLNLPRTPAPAEGFPVVAYFPGFAAWAGIYKTVPQRLLDEGFAVALMDLPHPTETSLATRAEFSVRAIDTLQSNFGDVVDMSKLSAVGHSFGGATVTVLGALDPRIQRTVAHAPRATPTPDALRQVLRLHLPTKNSLLEEAKRSEHAARLNIGAQFDTLVPPGQFVEPIHMTATAPEDSYILMLRAGHNNFADMPYAFMKLPYVTKTKDGVGVRFLKLTSASPRARSAKSQVLEAAEHT
ncbi:MAG: alpha/beta fold hydrolase, partial [Polyangiales bacterium]